MTGQNDDFEARLKRVQRRKGPPRPIHSARRQEEPAFRVDPKLITGLLTVLGFVLGVAAMIGSRAVAMHALGIEPEIHSLGVAEAGMVLGLLVVIGLVLGRRPSLAHGALLLGAAIAFFGERDYIPLMPEVMGVVYTPIYVAELMLELR